MCRREICNESSREFFYMCPRCNDVCDFWYYISGCTVARFSLVFDNGGTVFFAVFIMLWGMDEYKVHHHNKHVSVFVVISVCTFEPCYNVVKAQSQYYVLCVS